MDMNEAGIKLREMKLAGQNPPPLLKEEVVLAHLPLVRFIAGRITSNLPAHIDRDDLYNSGVLGLLDAIDRYDPKNEASFKTYAEFRVRGAMLDTLRAIDWVPRSIRSKQKRLERVRKEVEQRLGHTADCADIADALGISLENFHKLIGEIKVITITPLSDTPPGYEGERTSLEELIPDRKTQSPIQKIVHRETAQEIKATLAQIPKVEKFVLSLYFWSNLSEYQIGAMIGITESRVCQILGKALKRLARVPELKRLAS